MREITYILWIKIYRYKSRRLFELSQPIKNGLTLKNSRENTYKFYIGYVTSPIFTCNLYMISSC
jgi:hypothetical protein